jgi:PAS domain S-box-containing protein
MASPEKIDLQIAQLRGLCDTIKPCLDNLASKPEKEEVQNELEHAIRDLEKILKTVEVRQTGINHFNYLNDTNNGNKNYMILKTIVDYAPVGHIFLYQDAIQYANKTALRLLDYENQNELSGLSFSSLLSTTDKILNDIETKTQSVSFIKNVKKKNGNYFSALLTLTPIDQETSVLITIDDVDTQKLSFLVRENERLEYLLEESPAAIYSASHQHPYHVNYISPNIEKISGYSAENFTKYPSFWADRIHTEDAQIVFEKLPDVFIKGRNVLEYRFLFSDKTYHWMHDAFRLTFDQQGDINGIAGCWIDITEKKEAEMLALRLQNETETANEELQASQEELIQNLEKTIELNKALEESDKFIKEVISNINEGVFVLDKDLKFTLWNDYLESLSQISKEEVLGKYPAQVFADLNLKESQKTNFFTKALKGETTKYEGCHFKLRNKKSFWARGSFGPLKKNDDEIIGVIGTISDITEKKKAEDDLKKQKNLLQSFFDTATFYMGVIELVDNEYVFKLPNKKMAESFRKTVDEVKGKRASELGQKPEFIQYSYQLFKNCILTGDTMQREVNFTKASGKKMSFLYTFSPIDKKTISLIGVDITSNKIAEEEKNKLLAETQALNERLHENQKSLLEAQRLSRMGLWEFDIDKNIREWSEVMFELFGLDPKDKVPSIDQLWEMIAPEYRESMERNLKAAIQEGKEFRQEIKILPHDVPFRWMSSIGRAVFDPAGKVVKLIGIYYDITEQKTSNEKLKQLLIEYQETNTKLLASEEELKQSLESSLELNQKLYDSEQRWQFALEGSGDGVWDWNPKTNKVFYSRKMKLMMNYREEDEIDSYEDWSVKVHPEDIGYVEASLSNCFDGITEVFQTEYRLLGKDGYFWVLGRGKVLEWDTDGQPVRMVGTISDITKRKEYEVLLSNSADYLNKLINTIIDPIFVKDRNHKFILVNDACCQFFKMKREFMLGKTDFELIAEDKAEIFWDVDEHIFKYGNDDIREETVFFREGKVRNVLTKKSLYVDSRGDCLLVGIILDITEQKQMEQKLLEQNETLKKINLELDSFVYRTSHDLRSPLASILGLIHISKDEKVEEKRQEYMRLMEKSISKLDNFIHDIISFSKNTRIDISQNEINISEMLEEIIEGLRYMEGYEGIDKRVEVHQEAPFISDLFRIKIICNNLVSNAIKYSSFYAIDPFVLVKVFVNKKEAVFEFSDNGIGIAKENTPKLFSMFYRASTASKGSGLGLYIVKEVVQKLNGTITLESEPGKGTKFTVVLPNNLLQ